MTIKLIASDMDGTFLDEHGRYDKGRFEKLLEELEKKSIQFVVASSNGMQRLEMIFGNLTDRLSFVAENGSLVIDRGEVLAHKSIDRSLLTPFLNFFEEHQADYRLTISTDKGTYMLDTAEFPTETTIIDKE